MSNVTQFIHNFKEAAISGAKKLFPSVIMAQAILESGAGSSQLAAQHNNFFGIKAGNNWKGKFVVMPTREFDKSTGEFITVNARFRSYDNPAESFKDRDNFLYLNKRYRNAGVFEANNYEQQAVALQSAGYATDPTYAYKLITLIRQHNLDHLDFLKKKTDL